MRRIAWIATSIAILSVGLAVPMGAHEESPRIDRPPKEPGDDEAAVASERRTAAGSHRYENGVAEEIAEIRRAISEDVERTDSAPAFSALPGEPADDDLLNRSRFLAAIARLAAAQPRATKTGAAGLPAARPAAARPDRLARINPMPGQSSATVAAFRDAAWRLDQAAESLERGGLYQRADGLRDQAAEFRQEARDLLARNLGPPPDLVDTRPSCR